MGGIFENLSSHGISEISNRGIYIGVYRGDLTSLGGSWWTESLSCVRFFGGAFGSPLAMRVGVKEFALDESEFQSPHAIGFSHKERRSRSCTNGFSSCLNLDVQQRYYR